MIDLLPGPSKDSRVEKAPRAGPGPCKVCEGRATGYHYSVPACAACKTFFRRVVVNQRRYLCIDTDSTDSDTRTQEHLRICKKCRFDRCVNAGMDPLAVMSSSADASKNSIVKDILEKRRTSSSGNSEKSGSPELRLVAQPGVFELGIQAIIDRLARVEVAYTKLRRSKYQPPLDPTFTLGSMMEGPSKFGIEYGDMPGSPLTWERPMPSSVAVCLKSATPFPPIFNIRPPNAKIWQFADPVYAVEFTKTFHFIRGLAHTDKMIVCKHAALMVSHLTQAFYSYQKGSPCTEFPDGYKPYGGHIPADSEADQIQHTKAIRILVELKMDPTEYTLLKAIIACNPAYFGLSSSARATLSVEREKYAKSLLSYTLARRGVNEGPPAYSSMMAFVITLEHICAKIREIVNALHALGVFSQIKTAPFKMDLI